jgi:hypothetical protein
MIKEMFVKIARKLEMHEKAATTFSAIVQSVAVVFAGLWICGVFFYSEIVKPSLSETFLSPTLELVKIGVESERDGTNYVVMSLNLEMQNNSGQKVNIPSSFFMVSGDKYSTKSSTFNLSDLQRSINGFRGGRARFKGNAEFSEIVYVGSEYSGWQLAVGEKVTHSRLFRVPADRYDQLVADWYVVRRNANLDEVKVSQVVSDDSTYQFSVDSCGCIGACPDIGSVKTGVAPSGKCPYPWLDLNTPEGDDLLGSREKSGKSTVTSYFLMPRL